MKPIAIYQAVKFLLEQELESFHQEKRDEARMLISALDQEYAEFVSEYQESAKDQDADEKAKCDQEDNEAADHD